MSVLRKNNVRVDVAGRQAMPFAHGAGCGQGMWRCVEPTLSAPHDSVVAIRDYLR